jgi:hypothetical protein
MCTKEARLRRAQVLPLLETLALSITLDCIFWQLRHAVFYRY